MLFKEIQKKNIFPTTAPSLTEPLTLQINSPQRARDREGPGGNSAEGDDTL